MTNTRQLLPLPQHVAAKLLDTLAVGLIPPEYAPHLHVARKTELLRLNTGLRRVKDGGSVFNFLSGANGSGKTHLFDITEQVGLSQGLAQVRQSWRRK